LLFFICYFRPKCGIGREKQGFWSDMKKKLFLTALFLTQVLALQGSDGSASLLLNSDDLSAEVCFQEVSTRPFVSQTVAAKPPASSQNSQVEKVRHVEVEGRFAWFLPQDKAIYSIYGDHGYPEYQIEASVALSRVRKCVPCNYERACQPHWIAWGNWSFYEKSGHSTCLHNSTHMFNYAVNFGVKYYFFHMRSFRPYLGLGAGFAHVRFHDHSHSVRNHIDKWGPALLVKSGIECDLTCHVYADVFADYSSNWFSSPRSKHCVNTRSVNTGGGHFGLGLGYRY
jgi:hypothetical protein